jgi:hypothetical protein
MIHQAFKNVKLKGDYGQKKATNIQAVFGLLPEMVYNMGVITIYSYS